MGNPNINPDAQQKITDYINNVEGELNEVLVHLRNILISTEIGLEEDWEWDASNFNYKGMTCWLASFKKHVRVNFFKGSLITDKYNLFEKQYEDRINRMIKYTSLPKVNIEQLTYYL